MQNKKNFVLTFIIFLVLTVASFNASAQSIKFNQKIEWESDPNALEYKIEIESLTSSSVSKIIKTENCSVEFSMPAGDYKYRIYAYDFLGREASVTEWKNFKITKALKPVVNVKDNAVTVDGDNKRPVKLPVDVASITDESTITFVNTETGEKIKGKINTEKKADGSIASNSVEFPNVSIGEWKMVVTNPSGLFTESEPVVVAPSGKKMIIGKNVQKTDEVQKTEEEMLQPEKTEVAAVTANNESDEKENEEISEEKEKKPYVIQDINLTVGFIAPFVIADDYFASLNNSYFNYGGTIRLSWLPIDIKKVQLGFEAAYTNTFIDYQNSEIDFFLPMNICQLSVVSRFNFLNGKIGLNAKAGGGVSILKVDITYPNNAKKAVEPKHYGYPSVSAGLSFDWIPFKHVITEIGADVNYTIMPDVNALIILPYASVGVRF